MKRVLWPILSLIGILLTGCDHKDLSLYAIPSVDVRVEYDWSKAPDATPESMTAVFFRNDGQEQEPVTVAFPGNKGGLLRLPPATYHAISHNGDIYSWALFRGKDQMYDYELYTQDVEYLSVIGVSVHQLPRSESSSDERIALSPQMIWNSPLRDVKIDSKAQEDIKIVFTPEEAICYYDVTVINVKNFQYLNDSRIDATISGMAEGFKHGTHTPTSTPATMVFTLYPVNRASTPDNTLKSSFYTFGEPDGESPVHTVSIYVLFEDGTAGSYHYDVTNQVRNAPDPKHVHILLDGLTLPKPIVNGGGFHPTVDEWETENVPIDME